MANPYTRQSSFSDGDTINSALFNDEYDRLVEAFSTTGHTHDGSTGEGAPITKLGPTQDVVISSTSFLPKTNNTVDLGNASLKFKNAFFSGNVSVDGIVTHSGNIILGNAATDTLTINATIQGSSLVFEGATANAHEMTLAIPDVSADKTITFPNATDTLVGKATTDTLTNKTLTAPVISSITNSGTITLPTSTDTLVGRATTDTLTNKTLTSAVLTTPVLNTSVSGTAFLDEDNMVSNSATKIASQQSIKAYVDGQTTDLTAEGSTNLYYTNARADARIAANLIDEDNMSSNSATRLPSQQSVKAYVDAEVAGVPVGDVTSVVAGTGLTGGGTTGDVTVNVIGGTGITANANDIAIDSSVTTLTGTQTLSAKTLTSPVLNTGVSGTAVKDEDNMSSNSATHLATQQSIKAYVDAQTDQNFTNADHTKLDGIETGATADQTAAQIKTHLENGIDSIHYVDGSIDGVHIASNVALAGSPTTTTQAESDDSTKIATTAYVVDKITTLIGGAPSTLNDLNELAAAINDDASYNSTLTTALGTKLPKAGGAMTGNITMAGSQTVDGRDLSVDGAKLDGIEASATADQTTAQIKTHLENGIDSVHYVDGSIDTVHIGDDQVTADKLANSINTAIAANTAKTGITSGQTSAITANTAKVTNATHSGEVTGATALTIADNVVDEANLKVSNAPSNGYVLTAQSGNTGGMTWQTTAEALPSQTGNSGEFLTTNGSAASWAVIATGNTTANGLWEHSNTIASNYSIASGNNAMTAGPITINSNISVTVPSGSTWVIA